MELYVYRLQQIKKETAIHMMKKSINVEKNIFLY